MEGQEGGAGRRAGVQVWGGPEAADEAEPRRKLGQQRPRAVGAPALERPLPHACEDMAQPHGHHVTGSEVRLRRCGEGAHLRIDLRAHGNDPRHGAHAAFLFGEGCRVPSMEEASDDGTPEQCLFWTCTVL